MKKSIVLNNVHDVTNLHVKVAQGPVQPDTSFAGGTYGEFWITVTYKVKKGSFHGSYETGPKDTIVKNMRDRLENEMDELKEQYCQDIKTKGSIKINLDELASYFGRNYNPI